MHAWMNDWSFNILLAKKYLCNVLLKEAAQDLEDHEILKVS